MAFQLNCPNCGKRPYPEFWFGGELRAGVEPGPSPSPSSEEEYRRVWLPENVAGRQAERWFHFAGCRRWLTVDRDTVTNEVYDVR